MDDQPRGTVTFLFSDVDGSTEMVKSLGPRYANVLAEHRRLLRSEFVIHHGREVDTQGDAFCIAFGSAKDAVLAAVAAQRALAAHDWDEGIAPRVRMGLHTCEPDQSDEGFVGLGLHRAARICTLGHGGQVLLSRSTAGIADDHEITGVSARDLGDQTLKNFDQPERVYQLVVDGLPSKFPPRRTAREQAPLTGTVTIVMSEGRHVIGLSRELPPEVFGALIDEYQRVLREVLERMGGREFEAYADTSIAAFATAKEAALAATAVQHAVSAHSWPHKRNLMISVGVHSGTAGIGWLGPATMRCEELCDAAEAGQIFLSSATAALLEEEDLGGLRIRDVGERATRRSGSRVRAFELVASATADPSPSSAPA
jgi:class 3 adenylate cyclase